MKLLPALLKFKLTYPVSLSSQSGCVGVGWGGGKNEAEKQSSACPERRALKRAPPALGRLTGTPNTPPILCP